MQRFVRLIFNTRCLKINQVNMHYLGKKLDQGWLFPIHYSDHYSIIGKLLSYYHDRIYQNIITFLHFLIIPWILYCLFFYLLFFFFSWKYFLLMKMHIVSILLFFLQTLNFQVIIIAIFFIIITSINFNMFN